MAIERQNLQTHLEHVAQPRDPYLATGGHFLVREYIRQELQQWGSVEVHEFLSGTELHQNLILNLPGQQSSERPSEQLILIGAHYDAVLGSPGADDNATGIAALLELARYFSETPARVPLRFVAFDLEEYGMVGSQAYAALLQAQRQPIRLMLSLEMLGYCDSTPGSQQYPPGLSYFYPDRGNFIALIGNLAALPDLWRLSRALRRSGQVPCEWLPAGWRGHIVPDTRRSDHAPFWDAGYRAILVTDTANLRNPHYHRSSDRIETLDLDFLTSICQGLAGGLKSF